MPILLGLLFAVASAAGTPFTFRVNSDPETLDWNRAHTPVEAHLLVNLMEGLVWIDAQARAVPGLAEKWKVTDGGKTYTFFLRKNLKWSDGVALRAADFVASWKRLLTPETAAAYAYLLDDVVGAAEFRKSKSGDFSKVGVRALDERTLEVKLVQPIAHWIYIPSFWVTFPVREDLITKYGRKWTDAGKIVTTGPFTLAAQEVDRRLVLRPNPYYWAGAPKLAEVVAQVVREDSTALSLYESGKLDFMIDLPALDLERIRAMPGFKTFPYLKVVYVGLVLKHVSTGNVHLRKALAHALDRSKLPELLKSGQSQATGFLPPPMLGSKIRAQLAFDPVTAKKELQASGWSLTQPLDLVFLNSEKPTTVAEWMQGEIKRNLGLTLNLNPLDNKTFRAQVDMRAYPAFIMSWSADFPDPDNFMSLFQSTAGNNRTDWKSGEYDRWIVDARAQATPGKREALYAQAQKKLIVDDAVIVPLYFEPNLALVQKRVQGITLNPLNYLDLRKATLQ